jgi:hypothetical protein
MKRKLIALFCLISMVLSLSAFVYAMNYEPFTWENLPPSPKKLQIEKKFSSYDIALMQLMLFLNKIPSLFLKVKEPILSIIGYQLKMEEILSLLKEGIKINSDSVEKRKIHLVSKIAVRVILGNTEVGETNKYMLEACNFFNSSYEFLCSTIYFLYDNIVGPQVNFIQYLQTRGFSNFLPREIPNTQNLKLLPTQNPPEKKKDPQIQISGDYKEEDYKEEDYKEEDYKEEDYKEEDYKEEDYEEEDYEEEDYEEEDYEYLENPGNRKEDDEFSKEFDFFQDSSKDHKKENSEGEDCRDKYILQIEYTPSTDFEVEDSKPISLPQEQSWWCHKINENGKSRPKNQKFITKLTTILCIK